MNFQILIGVISLEPLVTLVANRCGEPAVYEAMRLKQEPSPVKPETASAAKVKKPWLTDAGSISAAAGFGAFVISIAALVISYRHTREQRVRQKREELRNAIERLISLREEINNIDPTLDSAVRNSKGSLINTKRTVYLQAAESLAEEVSQYVSSSEWQVLGAENEYESDFAHARYFYEKCVVASRRSSAGNQSVALRVLAASFYFPEPFRDLEKGRKRHQAAIDAVSNSDDPYSKYMQAHAYREWSSKEIAVNEAEEAVVRLTEASNIVKTLPEGYYLKNDEIKLIAVNWVYIGNLFFNRYAVDQSQAFLDKARNMFKTSLSMVENMKTDNAAFIRGFVYLEWSRSELKHGFLVRADQYIRTSQDFFSSLPETYPYRKMKMIEAHELRGLIELKPSGR